MAIKKELPNQEKNSLIEVVYYTDPLCCWSWGFELQWQRLCNEYGTWLKRRYCMAGLIPDWNVFHDSLNAVSRPAQMGPVWMEAHHLTGMPIRSDIWMRDPPASSYLACIAVKCAGLQSFTAGEILLRLLREAVMVDGRNIALQSVLMQVAREFTSLHPGMLDLKRFEKDLTSGTGKEAFSADLHEVQSLRISRLPTLIFRRDKMPSFILSGHRPYPVLLDIIRQLAPEIQLCSAEDAGLLRAQTGTG